MLKLLVAVFVIYLGVKIINKIAKAFLGKDERYDEWTKF